MVVHKLITLNEYVIIKKFNQEKKMACSRKRDSFTLAEVLITLGIIGVVASMTIPTLYNNYVERQWATSLTKFASTLQNAVDLWKQDIGCFSDAYTCLNMQGLPDGNPANFNQIGKFMKIADSIGCSNSKNWLPDDTFNYYGNSDTGRCGKVAHIGCCDQVYLLQDGTTFSIDVNPHEFIITVDVNGEKPPNRVGKDTFSFDIGYKTGKDIYFYPDRTNYSATNTAGLCGIWSVCDPDNTNPTVGNGASPTAYTLLNGKIPDFQQLSQTVSGFKP